MKLSEQVAVLEEEVRASQDTKQAARSMHGILSTLKNSNINFVKMYQVSDAKRFYVEITTMDGQFSYTSAKSLFHLFEMLSQHVPKMKTKPKGTNS